MYTYIVFVQNLASGTKWFFQVEAADLPEAVAKARVDFESQTEGRGRFEEDVYGILEAK